MPKRIITLDDICSYNYDELAYDILDHKHTKYVCKGGRGSLKSSFIACMIIILLTMPENRNLNAVVFRKTGSTLRDSVYAQLQFAIATLGLEDKFKMRANPMTITYIKTGQQILFRGVDDPMKVKSIKVPFGYFGLLWLEEADTFSGMEEIRSIEQSVLRGGTKFWEFWSFNPPISRSNFMNEEVLIDRPDRIVHHSDYRTVPREWLGDQFIFDAEMLRQTSPKAYKHEYLGFPTGTGGEVFENLDIRTITPAELSSFANIYMGIDWGWYPDPFHWAKMNYDANRRILYIFDEFRANKMSNQNTWNALHDEKGVSGSDLITADSAEPKSVGDYRSYGSNTRAAIKGADSVRYGMKWLQSLNKIVIDPHKCPYTQLEFSRYEYLRSKDDEVISAYPDANNHSIDAVRYAMEFVYKRKGQ